MYMYICISKMGMYIHKYIHLIKKGMYVYFQTRVCIYIHLYKGCVYIPIKKVCIYTSLKGYVYIHVNISIYPNILDI